MLNLAVIGDIHHYFTQFDVDYFNGSSYDLLLFTGDLPYHGSEADRALLQLLSSIEKPALLIPGNHDCVTNAQLVAEAYGRTRLADLLNPQQQNLVDALGTYLDPVVMCGYSSHEFCFGDTAYTVIAARPLSFGGPRLSYRRYLTTNFAIEELQASIDLLTELVDTSESNMIIFLGHNGPAGLGSRQEDIWGRDFKPEGGDYGDLDLHEAIVYAKASGKQVPLVIGGHMHHELHSGGQRQWLVEQPGTTYVNAARVPRIFEIKDQSYHHHVQIKIENAAVTVDERLVKSEAG